MNRSIGAKTWAIAEGTADRSPGSTATGMDRPVVAHRIAHAETGEPVHEPSTGQSARADLAGSNDAAVCAKDVRRPVPTASRIPNRESRGRVLFWPDTFNNYFHPQTAMAATEVLEHAGYEVVIPPKRLCCGRPLYDFGFLALAKKRLREIMRVLRPELERGTPIVGLEPSCVSVFRDELHGLFPSSEDAKRLGGSVWTLSEFLEREQCEIPQLHRKALVQAHCHHHAIMKFDAEERVMKKMGLEVEHPDSGCCGMAGAFGFMRDNYEVSLRVGERVLLPKVRDASAETLIIADGFSCREQIEQTTKRRALHLAEVLRMAYGR